jgi:ABC-2 type transport system permease protein
MMTLILFFYCLGALYDERRDRSILFWKSLPVSDRATVLSKVVACLIAAPLLYVAVGTLLGLASMLIVALTLLAKGINVFPVLLTTGQLYATPFELLALLPVYAVWALPAVGWLMLVSSWARSKPFLWAVGVPGLSALVLKYLTVTYHLDMNVDAVIQHILMRPLVSLVPGVWLPLMDVPPESLIHMQTHTIDIGMLVRGSWGTLVQPAAWIGALAGGAMLAGAVRLRRWRDEG